MKNLLISLAFLFSLSLVAYEAPGSVEEVPVPPFIDVEKADFTQAPDEHEVSTGDTLWDLSEKYLKSPWYWPKVWSINPQIKNPHLIYPGDKVYFRGTGEIMIPPTNEGGLAIGGDGESSEDLETDETARTGKTLDDKPENYKNYVKLGGKYRVDRFTQIEDTVLDVPYRGYVADETLKQSGTIMAAFDTKELLATEDSCYVQFTGKKLAIGDYLEFFRVVEEITHPVTNDVVGNHVEITGKGKIIDINKDGIATVRIIKAYTAVQREDSVREFQERRPNIKVEQLDNKKLQTIVLSGYDPVTMFGDGYLIYLDKGAKEGLAEGNMLTIHRRQDGLDTLDDEDLAKLPLEPIGEVVVVLTEAHTSVAIITKSILGIERGDIATATIFE